MTAGWEKIDHPRDTILPAIFILDAKTYINSTIPDAHKCAHYLAIDIMFFTLELP